MDGLEQNPFESPLTVGRVEEAPVDEIRPARVLVFETWKGCWAHFGERLAAAHGIGFLVLFALGLGNVIGTFSFVLAVDPLLTGEQTLEDGPMRVLVLAVAFALAWGLIWALSAVFVPAVAGLTLGLVQERRLSLAALRRGSGRNATFLIANVTFTVIVGWAFMLNNFVVWQEPASDRLLMAAVGLARLWILPALFLSASLGMYPFLILRGEGAWGAIRGSWRLTAGQRLPLAGLLVMVLVSAFAVFVLPVMCLGVATAAMAGLVRSATVAFSLIVLGVVVITSGALGFLAVSGAVVFERLCGKRF